MKSSRYQPGVLHEVLESNAQLPAFQHSRCQGNRKPNKEDRNWGKLLEL